MTSYRIEIVSAAEGMFAVEGHSGDGTKVRDSGPVFHSEEEADAAIKAMFDATWPAKDPVAVDSSIGV